MTLGEQIEHLFLIGISDYVNPKSVKPHPFTLTLEFILRKTERVKTCLLFIQKPSRCEGFCVIIWVLMIDFSQKTQKMPKEITDEQLQKTEIVNMQEEEKVGTE